MHDIQRVIKAAAWRLWASNFLHGLFMAIAASLVALILLRLLERLTAFMSVRWAIAAYTCAGVCVLMGIVWAIIKRPSRIAIARRIDEGANLREAISTAVYVADQSDPWSKATVESAARMARGVRVGAAVPIQAPQQWPVSLALGFALAIVFLVVPKIDLLGFRAKQQAKADEQVQVIQAKQEAVETKKKIEQMVKDLDLNKEPDKPQAQANEQPTPQTPEEIRKAAVKELSTLNDKLQELRTGEKAQKLNALKDQLKQLTPTGDETAELSKALASGNFSQAKEQLEKLAKQAGENGKMSQSEKQQLAKQVEDIAKQLDKMSQDKQGLENTLKQAGLDPALAKDPSSLQQALQQSQNLSDEQKKQLSQQAQACKQAGESMQGLSKAMSKAAQGMQSGEQQSSQEGSQSAKQQLSEMEQISQEMQTAESAQSQCQGAMASMSKSGGSGKEGEGEGQGSNTSQSNSNSTSPWSEGWNESSHGSGRGGMGQSRGGSNTAEQAGFDKETKKSLGKLGQGPIVGSRLVEGESIKGESRAQFQAVVAAGQQSATEAIENNTIPREYHDAVKNYFAGLKQDAAAPAKDAKDAKPETPTAPASDADKKK